MGPINGRTFAAHFTFDHLNNFSDLGLSKPLLKALPEMGIESPTEIQQQAIPLLLPEPRDFIGLAQTGTGKTAAFGLPLLDRIDPDWDSVQALVLAPTRELGQQIAGQLEAFSKYMKGVKVLPVYGGASISNQIKDLRKKPQIVIATPGRLIDLINRKAIRLDNIEYVVLDEADEMLNMGFREDMDTILSFTPEDKSTWLFSATMPKEIRHIIKEYMNDPAEVKVNTGQVVNANIEHQFVTLRRSDKYEGVQRLLDLHYQMRGLIFCRTKRETQELAELLSKKHYRVEALHGDLSQPQRDRVMARFKAHQLQALVATDVAARGIDVNDLTHVIHHSLPDDMSYYTHRSGRTARAGKQGISLAMVTQGEMRKLRWLEKELGIRFASTRIPAWSEIRENKIAQWAKDLAGPIPTDGVTPDLLRKVEPEFEHMDKSELIARLVARELSMLPSALEDRDLNDTGSSKDKPSRKPNGKTSRYFINLGTIDGVDKGSLVNFLSEVTGLKRNSFFAISLQKKNAFFEVEKTHDKKVAPAFKGITVEGRALRVNRDDMGGPPKKSSHRKGSKPKKKFRK